MILFAVVPLVIASKVTLLSQPFTLRNMNSSVDIMPIV